MSNDYRNESRARAPFDKYGAPGVSQPTPNPFVLDIVEDIPIRSENYTPVARGTPHPVHAAAILVFEGPIKGNNNEKSVRRIYASPRSGQEAFNVVQYDSTAENDSFPTFIRSFVELESSYAERSKGTALNAVIGFTVANGGSGYGAALPTPGYGEIDLTLTGGSGSGATARAEVVAGVIVAVILTNGGTGYATAPTVTIHPDVRVSGAGVPQANQLYTYNSGAWNSADGVTMLVKDTGSGQWLLIFTSDGEGSTGDAIYASTDSPANPWQAAGWTLDQAGVAPTPTVISLGSGASITAMVQNASCVLVSEKAVRAEEPLGSLYLRVTRVYETLPGPWLQSTRIDEDGTPLTVKRRNNLNGSITTAEAVSGGTWTKTTKEERDALVGTEVVESRAIPGTAIVEKFPDDDGIVVTETRTFKALADITESETATSTLWTIRRSKAVSALVGWQVDRVRALPGNPVTSTHVDSELNVQIVTTKTRRLASTITTQATVSGTTLTVVDKEPITAQVAFEVVSTVPEPAQNSLGNALVEAQWKNVEFPGYISIPILDVYGTNIGFQRGRTKEVPVTVRTWWKVANSQPSVSLDRITTRDIVINGVPYRDVLHDATTRLFPNNANQAVPFFFPATTPSALQYINSWIGQPKVRFAEAVPTRYQKLWKVTTWTVIMQ